MHNIAVFWDESHLWGILLGRSLQQHGNQSAASFRRADPGRRCRTQLPICCWFPAVGPDLNPVFGRRRPRNIRKYIRDGGRYRAFAADRTCPGFGRTYPLLDLCSWSRKPARERLPNFSGHLRCSLHMEDMKARFICPYGGRRNSRPIRKILWKLWPAMKSRGRISGPRI